MEGSASAPIGPFIEPEPREWQPRAMWVSARMLCGAQAFFFMSFLFAYFYLRSLDVNKSWKIGAVNPSIGLGIVIAVVLVASAASLHVAGTRSGAVLRLGSISLALLLLAVVLQVIEWTTLGFGPASGGYASVFIGWTSMYAVFALFCGYWIETQVATAWRAQREGPGLGGPNLLAAGIQACSFFWSFYVATGLVAFVILYVI
jgi:heme/copper-type cytochrome/quinol oxidase subunit 3